jgi:hypothetical protein
MIQAEIGGIRQGTLECWKKNEGGGKSKNGF